MHSSHVNGIITGFKGLSKNDVMKGGAATIDMKNFAVGVGDGRR